MSQTAKDYCDSIVANLIGYKIEELETRKTYQVVHVKVDADTILMCIVELKVMEIDVENQKLFVLPMDETDEMFIHFRNIGNFYRFFDTRQQADDTLDVICDYIENVMLAKKLLAAEQPDFKERKREILTAIEVQAKVLLTQMGLDNRMDNYPHQLSGGQCQRVAIARALAKNPKLLLCDEPTGALDYQTGKAILKLLRDTCRQKGMTVVVITHNMAIAPMADQVIRFKNGQVRNITRNSEPTPVEQIEW